MSGSQYTSIRTPILGIALCAVIALTGASYGQVTTNSLTIGGLGAMGCNAVPADPPTLEDGVAASGICDYEYNGATGILRITVTNTSPVIVGAPNPVITKIMTNLPQLAITSATLLSQVGAGGAIPSFVLSVDTDVGDEFGNLVGACFGKFGLRLERPGIPGGIANAAADNLPGPPGSIVIGPVVFEILLAGTPTLSTLIAQSFANSLSVIPPGSKQANAAFKFQGGGPTGAEGWIGNAPASNGGSAAGWLVGDPQPGNTVTIVQAGTPLWFGCYIVSLDPGPLYYYGLVVPIGFPFFPLSSGEIPPIGYLTNSFEIPDLGSPDIGTVTFYAIVVLASPDHRQLSISEQLSLSVDF